MDWRLIYRTRHDMVDLTTEIDEAELSDLTLFAEEKKVGHGERIVVAVGKSVNAYILRFFFRADGLVETFKQTAVQKGNGAKQGESGVDIGKFSFVAIEHVRHEVLVVPAKFTFAHFLIQRGEEKILQDGLVENGFVVVDFRWLKAFESLGKVTLTKKAIGDQSLFLHEPAKHEARDEANNRNVILAILFGRVFGKFRVVQCPEIPVGDFLEEPLVEFDARAFVVDR